VVYDNLVYGHEAAVKWGPLEIGELADRARLDAVIARHRPQAVMHFAAFTFVGESIADPGKYYRNNVAGTLSLLEAMRDHGIGQLVFSSTAATYGTPETVPIPESAAKAPINPYGHSKLTAEQMISDFAAAHGLRAAALRYFNAAGADADGEIGECHDPETHLIPLAMQAVTGDTPPLTIFGDDYPTPDGTCIRDYIHVTDLAAAHVLALDRLAEREGFDAFNLGTGTGASIREVLQAVEQASRAGPCRTRSARAARATPRCWSATRARPIASSAGPRARAILKRSSRPPGPGTAANQRDRLNVRHRRRVEQAAGPASLLERMASTSPIAAPTMRAVDR
jgi:UDP-arabinose 4-epimerase